MKNLTLKLTLFLLLYAIIGIGQNDTIVSIYGTQNQERGIVLTIDKEDFIYFLADETINQDYTVSKFRKVNAQGTLMLEFPLEKTISTFAKAIVFTKDEHLLCMYEIYPTNNGSILSPDSIGLQKINREGIVVWKKSIATPVFGAKSSGHLLEMEDSTLVMLSLKPFVSEYTYDGLNPTPYVIHLDKEGNYLSKTAMDGISSIRLRGMDLVEEGHIILSSFGEISGSVLAKVKVRDSLIVWQKEITVEGTTFNRAYDAILLPDQKSYGLVTNYANIDSELSGVNYFQLDLDGNILNRNIFTDGFSFAAFPRLILNQNDNLVISYNDYTEENKTILKRLKISKEGNLLQADKITPPSFNVSIVENIPLDNNKTIYLGSAQESLNDEFLSSFLLIVPNTDCVISSITDQNLFMTSVTIYPNPAYQHVIITFDGPIREEMVLNLRNSHGLLMKSWKSPKLNSDFQFPLDLGQISSGMYFLTINTQNSKITSRLLIH